VDGELLEERARIFREIRQFFDLRAYLEVDTPLLAPDLIPESCLEVFETSRLFPGSGTPRPYWLIPSPEIWMKRLIARHRRNIYQICRCFRNGESSGRLHSPEFTMLEYYTMDAGYLDSLTLTEALFHTLAEELPRDLRPPFVRITVEEAFSRWAGFDLFKAVDQGRLAAEARRLGLDPPPGLGTAALYDLIFVHAVENALPRDAPVALLDYPAFVPCLAQKAPGGKTVERWELYVRGIELANCYAEATDPAEVRRFFEEEARAKEEAALVRHHIDRDYWKLFQPDPAGRPFPRCSGVALGLDRLVMALTGRAAIDGVLPFPM
jgi:lysyl-tRNA synthetase class 2